jgi:hypothetical protein
MAGDPVGAAAVSDLEQGGGALAHGRCGMAGARIHQRLAVGVGWGSDRVRVRNRAIGVSI